METYQSILVPYLSAVIGRKRAIQQAPCLTSCIDGMPTFAVTLVTIKYIQHPTFVTQRSRLWSWMIDSQLLAQQQN